MGQKGSVGLTSARKILLGATRAQWGLLALNMDLLDAVGINGAQNGSDGITGPQRLKRNYWRSITLTGTHRDHKGSVGSLSDLNY